MHAHPVHGETSYACFAPSTAVNVPRGEVDAVVTEYGVADLRDKTIDGRAEALIGVAAPAFRDALGDAWDARRRRM